MDRVLSNQFSEILLRMRQIYSEMKDVLAFLISNPDELISNTKKIS